MKNAMKSSKRPPRRFAAAEKCRAVLLVWTEKRSASELAREMGLTWAALSQWQEQAMGGMLSALEPKRRTQAQPNPLNARLQQLLERTSAQPGRQVPALPAGLQKRLAEQQERVRESPPPP